MKYCVVKIIKQYTNTNKCTMTHRLLITITFQFQQLRAPTNGHCKQVKPRNNYHHNFLTQQWF